MLTFPSATGLVAASLLAFGLAGLGGSLVVRSSNDPVAAADRAIARFEAFELDADRDSPWLIAHAAIAFGNTQKVMLSEDAGQVGAVDYLLGHATFDGARIYRLVDGRPVVPEGAFGRFVETHTDQFLMVYAEAGTASDAPVIFENGHVMTVGDLVDASAAGFDAADELGWTLMALSAYRDGDFSWRTLEGERWSIADVLEAAIRRDPRWETEGGAHHLYGIAYALHSYRSVPTASPDLVRRIEEYLGRYARLARGFQGKDGAFSAAMLRGPVPPRSPEQLVWSTGHTLEWLSLALPATELREDWIRRAADLLGETLIKVDVDTNRAANPFRPSQLGAAYHAVHALGLYRERLHQAAGNPIQHSDPGL